MMERKGALMMRHSANSYVIQERTCGSFIPVGKSVAFTPDNKMQRNVFELYSKKTIDHCISPSSVTSQFSASSTVSYNSYSSVQVRHEVHSQRRALCTLICIYDLRDTHNWLVSL